MAFEKQMSMKDGISFNTRGMTEHLSNWDINIAGVRHDFFQKTCGYEEGRSDNWILKLILNCETVKHVKESYE